MSPKILAALIASFAIAPVFAADASAAVPADASGVAAAVPAIAAPTVSTATPLLSSARPAGAKDATTPVYTGRQTDGIRVYDDGTNSMTVGGSLRFKATMSEKNGDKGGAKKASIADDGSRIGIGMRHNFNQDSYAIGYFEMGTKGLDTANSNEDSGMVTRQAFVGLGSDQYGTVTFGKQYAPTDEVLNAQDFTYVVGGRTKHDTSGMSTDFVNNAVMYTKSTDHLKITAQLQGTDTVDNIGFGKGWGSSDKVGLVDAFGDGAATVDGSAGLAATYTLGNGVVIKGVGIYNKYTMDNGLSYEGNTTSLGGNVSYETPNKKLKFGMQLTYYRNDVSDLTNAHSGGGYHGGDASADFETVSSVGLGARYNFAPSWNAYVGYDGDWGGGAMDGQNLQTESVGVEYWPVKDRAVTYLEVAHQDSNGNDLGSDNIGVLGLRVFM